MTRSEQCNVCEVYWRQDSSMFCSTIFIDLPVMKLGLSVGASPSASLTDLKFLACQPVGLVEGV